MSFVSGKVAIVTGSAQGIGKAIAKSLLLRGAKVCVTDINVSKLEETKTELEEQFDSKHSALFLPCDVKNEKDFTELFEKVKSTFHGIDIVVNNAGVLDELDWRNCIDTNLKGVMCGSYLAMEHMRKDKGGNGGTILNISSGAGLAPCSYMPAYSASKHGIVGFTRSWALCPVAKNNNIRFLCLCPSFVVTDMLSPAFVYDEDRMKELQHERGKMTPDEAAVFVIQMLEEPNNPETVAHIAKETGLVYIQVE